MPLRLVFVAAGKETLLRNIGVGSYVVTIHSGSKWDARRLKFVENHLTSGPWGPFQFLQIQGSQGTSSDHYELVLKP